MKIVTLEDIQVLVKRFGFENLIIKLVERLDNDFSHWNDFQLSPRHASHYPFGVIELMPCSSEQFYTFKYVNGHPKNTQEGKLSVVAIGVLADVDSGYPLMLSEMTLLTALRTAATAVLGANYLARKDSHRLGIIGTGAQSEFQVRSFKPFFPIDTVKLFDVDEKAMEKFSENMKPHFPNLCPCDSVGEAFENNDVVISATASKNKQQLIAPEQLYEGLHIHAMGGDCPGKTEFSGETIKQCKVVVEYTEQSLLEGEIQQCDESAVYAELREIVSGDKPGRESDQEITLFDSVGFALEDYSVLTLINELTDEMKLGKSMDMIPDLEDPKNLYALLSAEN